MGGRVCRDLQTFVENVDGDDGGCPATLAPMIPDRPTAPVPATAIVPPRGTASELSTVPAPVCIPQPSGPTSSTGTPAGLQVLFLRDSVGGERRLTEEVARHPVAVRVGERGGAVLAGATEVECHEVDTVGLAPGQAVAAPAARRKDKARRHRRQRNR